MAEMRRSGRGRGSVVALMVTLLLLIVFSTAILFLPEEEAKEKRSGGMPTVTPTVGVAAVPAFKEQLAVVLDVDTEEKMITVYDVKADEEQRLVYTGATTFFDGYQVQQSAAQLVKGGLYRFTIDTKEEWISTAREAVERTEKPGNNSVWEKTGVNYMVISQDKISFRNQNYRYSEGLCVMNNGEQISLSDIVPEVDVVTVRGEGQVIYEIEVTKGHGYIALENHEDFIGGTITIGSTRIDSITEDAKYLVREGTYEVTVDHGKYQGTEEITVARDTTAVFNVFEYGSGPIQKGWLTIQIEPLGADLYIDGNKTVYTDGVELEYGTYVFEFSEGGYISYKATVLIDQPKQSLSVFLTEQKVEEPEDDEDTTKDPAEESGENDSDGEETGSGEDDTEEEIPEETTAYQTSVSIAYLPQYTLNVNNAIYVLGPVDSEIYLDGTYLGTAPLDFEKIIGAYVIKVIRTDGKEKEFHVVETDNGRDSYYNFSWID